jgi:hypothetical protein
LYEISRCAHGVQKTSVAPASAAAAAPKLITTSLALLTLYVVFGSTRIYISIHPFTSSRYYSASNRNSSRCIMDWTGRLLPLSEYGPNSEYGSNSGYASTSSDLPQQQTVALKDLDLGRWRSATSYGGDMSTSNDYIYDIQNERLDTSLQVTHAESLEQSGEVSPTNYRSGITFDSPKSDTSMESNDTDDEPDLLWLATRSSS